MSIYKYNLIPSYWRYFYLQDENVEDDLSGSWTEYAERNLLALEPGALGVGTLSSGEIAVEVHVVDSIPTDDFESWDHVMECDLEVPSSIVVIAGAMDFFPQPPALKWGRDAT